MAALDGLRVAILAAEGFEQPELLEPRKALDQAGAKSSVVKGRTGAHARRSSTGAKSKGREHRAAH